MKQYQALVQDVITNGEVHENRTGVKTIRIDGAMMRFNLADGFPAITTKKLAFKSVVAEVCAFFRGATNAATFRELGCKVWDQNANENKEWLANPFRKGPDDLGPVYGAQWRNWPAYTMVRDPWGDNGPAGDKAFHDSCQKLTDEGWERIGTENDHDFEDRSSPIFFKKIDQLRDCLETIINDPDNRRILFHAWNPALLNQIALPACHILYQFIPNKKTKQMSMCVYLRSNDVGLGTPFNQAEAAIMLELVCHLTGYVAKTLTIFIGDCHIYENHMDMLNEQLRREPFPLPKLVISARVPKYSETNVFAPEWLRMVEPSDFTLEGYQHHPAISAPMAV